ncbi:soul heme-binding protein [Brumimicrobium salinarum]|uniref:Soul heme-binding protein n=1 Tax=Brumimicrobium salinarum TaxID=2058658 RepID=A0A2I0R3C2_9FLAO|nr:heme-binding protein [Brumimicrobium salinarum]PKR81067.1 soul heme-binding protein [Brumimicrobium salinarum]
MKIFFIILGVIISAFIAVQIYAMSIRKDSETYPYEVVKKYENFEIREYESRLFSTVKLDTKDYDQASREGFSILAAYIFGGNDKNEKIAMTSPVKMSLEDSMTVMFMVPEDKKQEDLPNPNTSKIEFQTAPHKKVAAITFAGWASAEKIEKYKNQLIKLLKEENIAHTQNFFFLGYNPPFDVVNRRNEVIVELSQ